MFSEIIEVNKNDRTQDLIVQLLKLWEKSVRITHLFLSESELENIKKFVPKAIRSVSVFIVAKDNEDNPIAFMGIEKNRLEMLFVDETVIQKGIGTMLIHKAIEEYSVKELCVNEQNSVARKFYENRGFQVYKRTENDEQGNPYPLLYMKLVK